MHAEVFDSDQDGNVDFKDFWKAQLETLESLKMHMKHRTPCGRHRTPTVFTESTSENLLTSDPQPFPNLALRPFGILYSSFQALVTTWFPLVSGTHLPRQKSPIVGSISGEIHSVRVGGGGGLVQDGLLDSALVAMAIVGVLFKKGSWVPATASVDC